MQLFIKTIIGFIFLVSSSICLPGQNTLLNDSTILDDYLLEEVVVTGTRSERLLKDVPVTTILIPSRTIEQSQAGNLKDLLNYELPGIHFQNNGGYDNISMLGFDAKYILFLIDGERLSGETFNNLDYNRINLSNVERIEIVKGASSSLYGSNAIGGVINIITKKPEKKIEISGRGYIESEGENNYSLSLSHRNKWFGTSVIASRKIRSPYVIKDTEGPKQEYEDGSVVDGVPVTTYVAGYEDYSITPRFFFYPTDKLDIEVRGEYFYKERNPGGQPGEKERNRFYDYSGGLKADYALSGDHQLLFSANYDRYAKEDYFRLLDETEKTYTNTQKNTSLLYNGTLALTHNVVAGLEYFDDYLLTDMFKSDGSNDGRNAQTYSAFLHEEWMISPRFTLTGGLRYDYHSAFKGHLSPKLSLMFRIPYVTFRSGYAAGFRAPTLKELYTDWFHPNAGGFQIVGNEDLKPEKSNNFSFSVEYAKSGTTLSVMGQYSAMSNKIDRIWLSGDTTQYVNLGNVDITSLEFSAQHKFGFGMSVSAAYTYVRYGDPKVSTARPHTFFTKIDYGRAFIKKYRSSFSLSGKMTGAMDVWNETTESLSDAQKRYKVHHQAYSNWRLAYSQELLYGLNLGAGINNLFDYRPAFWSFYSNLTPGRTFFVGLSWNFNQL
ncbi:TonB-dependent receptor plug domain-containing protein [Proteiniphilum acetatigenes]|uniref:TonB-dependent receptor plug domain-containing protein n=1 Tax=Proteiniphilum acetatigenes TaxID=294710 RepID=UPI00035D9F96|nr:TonB-dependent receptor [Proteiniphilum acetatigenes]